jgi:hypothetical protein
MQRTADAVPLPEARVADSAKRARSRNEQETTDWIVVSSGPTEDHTQTAREDEHLKSGPEFELSRPASAVDGVNLQSSRQVSSEDCCAVQRARMALAVDAYMTECSRTEPSQDNLPPDSKLRPNRSPTHSPSSASRVIEPPACTHRELSSLTEDLGALANESHNTGLLSQSRNHPNDSQPPTPSFSSSTNSQEPSKINALSSSKQDRHSSLLVSPETKQDPGGVWNAQRDGNPRQECRRPVSEPLRTSPTAQHSQSASLGNNSACPNGTHHPKTLNNNVSRITFGSSDSEPLRSMPQHADLPRAPLTMPNHTSTQDIDAGNQPFQPRNIGSADSAGRIHLSDPLKASYPPVGCPNTTKPVTDPRDNYQAPLHRQASSYQRNELGPGDPVNRKQRQPVGIGNTNPLTQRVGSDYPRLNEQNPHASSPGLTLPLQSASQPPPVVFTIDNRVESVLSTDAMQYYFELFSRNVQVFLRPKKNPIRDKPYPVGVIMWQYSPDFYKWYVAETGTTGISSLRFELYNAKSDLQNTILVPKGSLQHFQMLKQYIWDFFWGGSKVNTALATFKVVIRAGQHLPSEAFPQGLVGTEGNTTASTLPAGPFTTPGFGNDARDSNSQQTFVAPLPAPEIIIRLQTDGTGKLSNPYEKSVLRPTITVAEFFAWFSSQTGRGGYEGPPFLRFTFKDAIPLPTSSTIAQGNEDHFNLLREVIKTHFETTRKYVPNLKEFAVVVTDPRWVSEQEDW